MHTYFNVSSLGEGLCVFDFHILAHLSRTICLPYVCVGVKTTGVLDDILLTVLRMSYQSNRFCLSEDLLGTTMEGIFRRRSTNMNKYSGSTRSASDMSSIDASL